MSNQGKYGDLDDILSPESAEVPVKRRTKRPTPALGAMQGRDRPVPLTELLKAEKNAAQEALREAQSEFDQQKAGWLAELEQVRREQSQQAPLVLVMPMSHKKVAFKLQEIEPESIDVSPENERIQSYLDEISLSDILPSIEKHGQQKPGTLRPKADGRYELIEGSRRLAAAKLLGRRYMALVGEVPDDDVRALSIIENQHQDVSPYEKAKAYERRILQGEFASWTQLGAKLGISSSHIGRYKACVELDDIFVRVLPSPSDMPLSYAETIAALMRKNASAVMSMAGELLERRELSLRQGQASLSIDEIIAAFKRAVRVAEEKPSARKAVAFVSRDGATLLKHSISRRTGSNKFELIGVSEEKLGQIRDYIVRTLSLNLK